MNFEKINAVHLEIETRIVTGVKQKYPDEFWELSYDERMEILRRLRG